MTDDGATMSLIEHLEELRRRLIIVVISILVAAAAGFAVSGPVLNLLRAPLPDAYQTLYFTGPADAFGAQLKIAGFLGIALAMPVILFEVWRFVTPGLTSRERRFIWPVILAALLLFVLGVVIGYVVIPYAFNFLLSFGGDTLEPLLTVDKYIGFVTTMLLAFGLVLEFPIVLIGLARVGILTHRRLAAQRRWAIVIIVLLAIVLTPGGDPISPLILSGVMFLLFEGSLLIIRLIRR
ncbi:MAG: twin-arginine translocase subunit TatC [Chloroflexota bacterium]|nr:twin-arginine translocase subunit TatC [Chloroflexota bacterium]